MNRPVLVSVVVIGRNEGSRLRQCLASVAAMKREGFRTELLYVDSGSTDGSIDAALEAGAVPIPLHSATPTAAMGRNGGWRSAAGEIILFLDGDTVLDPHFVRDSLAEFADPALAIVWGHRRETFAKASIYNRVLDLDWIYAPGYAAFCGGDALFRREALEAAGGFDDSLIAGEEPELCRRITLLGWKILHVDRAMTGHDLAITRFAQYWRRATRAGHAYAEVSQRFRHTQQPFWQVESRRNVVRAAILAGVALAGALAAMLLARMWPLLLAFAILLALSLRSAWKARWKTRDSVALLLYGAHSHFQQIPILCGQLQFWRNQRSGRQAAVVEYKNS